MIQKILSIMKWVVVMTLPLIALLTAPILYPIAYMLRNYKSRPDTEDDDILFDSNGDVLFNDEGGALFDEDGGWLVWADKKPLWWWFDDEDGLYGAEYWKAAKGITRDNFWTSYRWLALRNPMWNMHTELVPIEGEEVHVSESGSLTRDGKPIALSNVAVMMYVDRDGKWSHNTGEYLSLKYSAIGTVFLWFKIKNKLYWRYSTVRKLVGRFYIEIQLGVGYRYTFRFKPKIVKTYEDFVKGSI